MKRIRRQFDKLTPQDLIESPVWEFALDEEGEEGQDETTIRPVQVSGPIDPAEGMFIVRAEFTLADGSAMHGCLTPPPKGDNSLGTIQPVIVTERGLVLFWHGAFKPDAQQLARDYEILGRDRAHTFPLKFRSQVELVGGQVGGTIRGFVVLTNPSTGTTEVLS